MANGIHERLPAAGAREPIECGRRIGFEHRLPFQREHSVTKPLGRRRGAGIDLVPVVGIADGTMARRAHLEHQRRPTPADANLVTLDRQRHPFIPTRALSRRIELLDEKSCTSARHSSGPNPRVVADDDEWNAEW